MINIVATPWKMLTPNAQVAYRINERGQVAVQSKLSGQVPFAAPPSYEWQTGAASDEWVLRTKGMPTSMTRIFTAFYNAAKASSDRHAVDERIILTTIACESAGDPSHPSGRDVKSPRTEPGYPERQGDADHGDFNRDARDWANYLKRRDEQGRPQGTSRSSHGLMQTLISTAVAAAPRHFQGIDPSQYRTVLWDPAVSIECGASYFGGFPNGDRLDPVRARIKYAAGGVYPIASNRWGALMWDERTNDTRVPKGVAHEGPIILNWLAFWNDLAAVRGLASTPSQVGSAVVGLLCVLGLGGGALGALVAMRGA